MKYNELILKVSSCCNLNCDYCYVFNQGDTSYKKEPSLLDKRFIPLIIHRIEEHCLEHHINKFFVVFHGGEPLMHQKTFYEEFVHTANNIQSKIEFEYGVQTNATLLTQEWIDLFKRLNIHIGVSIDGPQEASIHRVLRKNGYPAYDQIIRGIELIKKNDLPLCTLSVINTEYPANYIYKYIKDLKVGFADFLFPDVTYNHTVDNNKIANWLIELFDCWYEDNCPKPKIRYFELIIKLLMGADLGFEALGQHENRTLCIKTNGDIDLVDSLKICGDGFTHTGMNVEFNTLDETFEHKILHDYYYSHSESVLCSQCNCCVVRNICGGGKYPHRYSSTNGFDNPSVYCTSIKSLLVHIQNRLFNDLPSIATKCNVNRLNKIV